MGGHHGRSVFVLNAPGREGARELVAAALGKDIDRDGPLAGCSAEVGVIYAGVDLTKYDAVPTPEVCCNLCSNHEECAYWAWSSDPAHENTCWLKSSREHRMTHSNFISGRSK